MQIEIKFIWVCLCFLLVQTIRLGKEPVTTTREQIIRAKKLYESAFHPDSGELQNIFGRMSFQVPGGMILTGAMLQFYRTVPQIVISQWANQSFSKWFWSVWEKGVYVSGRFYIFLYPQNLSRCVGQLHKSKCQFTIDCNPIGCIICLGYIERIGCGCPIQRIFAKSGQPICSGKSHW